MELHGVGMDKYRKEHPAKTVEIDSYYIEFLEDIIDEHRHYAVQKGLRTRLQGRDEAERAANASSWFVSYRSRTRVRDKTNRLHEVPRALYRVLHVKCSRQMFTVDDIEETELTS